MSLTKPYFVHLVTEQGESPYLWGFPQPEPVLKGTVVNSAGWANRKGDPQNKTMYPQLQPVTYPLIGIEDAENQFTSLYDQEYKALPNYGPHIRMRQDLQPLYYRQRIERPRKEESDIEDLIAGTAKMKITQNRDQDVEDIIAGTATMKISQSQVQG